MILGDFFKALMQLPDARFQSVLWRGVAPGPQIRDGASFVVIGDEHQRFTTFPISVRDPQSGLQQHNWIAQLAFDPHRGWRRGDWNTQVRPTTSWRPSRTGCSSGSTSRR